MMMGLQPPGIRSLIKIMNTIGEVVVVAPDSPHSGMGHAITINSTLYCPQNQECGGASNGIQLFRNSSGLCQLGRQ